jgi:hypothetical protein
LFPLAQKKENANAQTAHLQTSKSDPQTKVCKRAVFAFNMKKQRSFGSNMAIIT